MAGFNFQKAFDGVNEQLRGIRDDTIEHRTKLEELLGNGQPGTIQRIEKDIDKLKDWKATSKGWIAAVAAMATGAGVIGHFLIDIFKSKH